MRVLFCDSCGAPLDAPWHELVVRCVYCGNDNLPANVPVPASMPVDGRPRINVAGRTYVLEALLAHGDASDVFRARWVMRLGERVVVKVLRAPADVGLARRGWNTLRQLTRPAAGVDDRLARRLPQPIGLDALPGAPDRVVAVYGWQPGFVHTLAEVIAAYPSGLDPRAVAWVVKRLLELLSYAHGQGVVHGAIWPAHVLVHPRAHGAMLVGWSSAVPSGERLVAFSQANRAQYPSGVVSGGPVSPRTDLMMVGQLAIALAGGPGWLSRAGALPGDVGRVLVDASRGGYSDAWALREALDAAILRAFGPPSYNPIRMPGWPR